MTNKTNATNKIFKLLENNLNNVEFFWQRDSSWDSVVSICDDYFEYILQISEINTTRKIIPEWFDRKNYVLAMDQLRKKINK